MILPTPGQILRALIAGFATACRRATAGHRAGGCDRLCAGRVALGLLLGTPIALSRTVEVPINWYILGIQAMPKVARAADDDLGRRRHDFEGHHHDHRRAVSAMVNVIIGLRSVDRTASPSCAR
jgi:hypothetical protein